MSPHLGGDIVKEGGRAEWTQPSGLQAKFHHGFLPILMAIP